MKPKKAIVERIATITPIATRNTPFTISLMMPKGCRTPRRRCAPLSRISQTLCTAPFVWNLPLPSYLRCFWFFIFLMRIQELRELSFKLSYLPLVYPTFFLCVFLSHRSFSFRVLEKVGIRECKVFRSKYYPQGWRFLPKTGGLTLLSRPIPELPLRPERKWLTDAAYWKAQNGGKRKQRQIV